MNLKNCVAMAAAALAFVAGQAQATVQTYYFQDDLGRSGSFTYDDSLSATTSGTDYDTFTGPSLNLIVDGVSFNASGTTVQMYNDYGSFNDDLATFSGTSSVAVDATLTLFDKNAAVFTSRALSNLNGKTLADYVENIAFHNTLYVNGDFGNLTYLGTTPAPAPVPEADTWAMMLLGAAGLAAQARRRKARSAV